MNFRKIIQFGDVFDDGIFIFTPFEEEDDMGDTVEPGLIPLPQADGSYRSRGFDQSRKPQKTVTKRFIFHDKKLSEFVERNNTSILGKPIAKANKSAYMSDFVDYLYRTLRGGVKRLYVLTEDGSIRWTWAEAISIPYQASFGDPKTWRAFSVDFILHDPYWYDVIDNFTFLYSPAVVPFQALVNPCADLNSLTPTMSIVKESKLLFDQCEYNGVIVKNSNFAGYIGEENICNYPECGVDPCFGPIGPGIITDGTTTIDICVTGSAGAGRPTITFRSEFTNPKVTNTRNDCYVEYTGAIAEGEYLTIYLDSTDNGEVADMEIDTNITGFDYTDITINNDGFFDLEKGVNQLIVEGGTDVNSQFHINYSNKYHN